MTKTVSVLPLALDRRDVRLAELENQLRQREALIEQLQQRVAELEQGLAELDRTAKRQATPLARQRRVETPKRPGGKAGQGQFRARFTDEPEYLYNFIG